MAERFFKSYEDALQHCRPGETVSFPNGSLSFGEKSFQAVADRRRKAELEALRLAYSMPAKTVRITDD
jgi:hypothetical protein